MSKQQKVLLLDDDPDLLEVYTEMLVRLPSKPEIRTAASGARAIAILESEPFSLLISDLNMPKMDGLQVLTIVRRKFPQIRTAVLTGVVDEQLRARSYSMGIDLYLEKPSTHKEITFFLDCIESLLDREVEGGFRGVQSKSLVDLIQLECLSQSSSGLKISNNQSEGVIWILNGDVVDAEFDDIRGEEAFYKILSWKTGNFEILPGDSKRERTIFTSHQGLLLEFAQAQDEADMTSGGLDAEGEPSNIAPEGTILGKVARNKGVEFAVQIPADGKEIQSWGRENPEDIASWVKKTLEDFQEIGDQLRAGELQEVDASGGQCHLVIQNRFGSSLCVGFNRSISSQIVRQSMKKIGEEWES